MACGCGKPKCNGKCGISPAVLQINNSECTLFHRVDVPASMGDSTENPPKNGAYRNVLLYYEADENAFLYNSDGIPTRITGVSTDYNLLRNKPSINDTVLIGNKTLAELGIIDAIDTAVAGEAAIREEEDGKLSKAIDDEEADRIAADNRLWDEIETIEASSDVVDVVGSYAELEAYDTSKLHDNDLIKVLQDETRDDAITYYRWSTTTETFSYVGEEGPYYTQSETDTLLGEKQDTLIAGDNIQIAADGKTISATDTTYTAGSGLDLTGTEFSVDTTTIQEKLTAGTNVQISNQNVISATDTTYTAGTGLTLSGTEFSADNSVVAFKSDLPTKTSDLTNDGADGTSTYAETDELPTKTSDLSNDGDDGTSPYATQDYVDTYGGKIDKIEVNGVEQTIVNKTVDITVPTKTSELTNDSNFPVDANYVHTDNNFTTALKNKLDGIESGAEVNVQSDWSQATTTADDYIKNKPTKTSDFTNDGSDGTSVYVEADELATVATTGSYADLSNKPTIGDAILTIQKNSTTIDTFTANATSNKTIDISVPVDTSDLNNDGDGNSPYATQDYVDTYGGKIDKIEVNGVEQTITNKTVDIAVPTKTSDITNDGSDGTSTYVENDDLATTLSGYQEKLIAGSNIQIAADGKTISATDTTYSTMTGATSQDAGTSGLVPAPAAGDNTKYLSGDGVWKTISQYQLPIASDSTLGGVKVGSNLSIDSSTGVLSANVNNATLTIQKNGTSAGTFTANASSNKTINITVPTTAADVSALPDSTKYAASISVSVDTTDYKITTTLKDQDGNTLGTAQVIDLPLESVVVNGSYDNANKKIILTLQNGNTIDIPVADLVAGLQTEITAQNMLSSDLVDDTNHTHKFVTAAQITKLNGIATGAEVNQNAFSNVKVGSTTVSADTKTDTLELVAGSNVTLTPDATNDKVTIAATDTTYSDATTSAHGLMSAADKTKLNGIATGAEVNVQSDWNVTDNTSDAFIKNKPTIPTVNNATLTIQKNGTNVQTFTANQSTNATANITVPTKTSDITNDSGFVTGSITKANSGTLGTTTIGSTTANYMEVTKLSTATDLNTIKTTGTYIIAATPTNSPTGAWGTMYVDWTAGTKYQVYINDGVSGNIFKRSWDSSNSTWTSWIRITSADIANIERFYRGLVPLGTAIAANKNLNTTEFLKVGKYYCSLDATVATLTNCPTSNAFMMEVFSPLTTTIDNETTSPWIYRVRILTTHVGKMYIQRANSGSTAGTFSYGAWEEFAYTSNLNAKPNSYWGTCTTAAATAAKVVTVSSDQNFKLVPGAMVTFKAPNTNTAQNPTINVNSTGAKPVWYNSAVVATNNLNKAGQINRPATYIYDGTNWVWVSWSLDADTTYSTMSVSEGTTGTATSARTMRADYLKQIIEHYNPTKTSDLTNDGADSTSTYVEADQLATVATSGSYNDLSNKPTIPTVNNGTLTIQKNGTNVQTFTANSSTNKTANITVPTKTSDLTNDSGFLSSVAWGDVTGKPTFATVATSGSYNDLSNKPTIPTVNNATLTIQKNGATVNTFTANSSNNVTANIPVPTLATTNTDPGEGAALAADTFLGVYDIAPTAIDGSRITNGTVTTNKLAGNAVTAAKVDFSTFGVAATVNGPASTTSKSNGATWASTDMYSGSVSLAAGTYLVVVTGSAVAFSAGGEQEWFNVTIDSTIVMTGSLAWFTGSVVGGNGVGIATIGTSGTHTVAYQLGAQGSRTCTLYSGSKIQFVRIG